MVQPVLVLREAPYVLGLAEAITNAENLIAMVANWPNVLWAARGAA